MICVPDPDHINSFYIGLKYAEELWRACTGGGDDGAVSRWDFVSDACGVGDALRRLVEAGVPLDGVSEALYLRDPDANGVELYWDRPREEWPRTKDGEIAMVTGPLDLRGLLAAAE